MKNLIRKATLTGCALLVAGAAYAGAPSSGNSTKPVGIQLVGTNGFGPNAADPRGNVTWIIRDAVPNPIPNAQVCINFGGCPQIRLCQNGTSGGTATCVGPNGQGTVCGTTNGSGSVTFSIVGSVDVPSPSPNANFPEPDPPVMTGGIQTYFGCATVMVTAPGFPPAAYPNVIVAAYDHELISSGVGSGDIGFWGSDFLSGNYRERSDYNVSLSANAAGVIQSNDLSELGATFLQGGSTNSCTPGQGGTPCP